MSRRTINFDPAEARRKEYESLERSGEAQEALWEALAAIADYGIDLGQKGTEVIARRKAIKQKYPKKK